MKFSFNEISYKNILSEIETANSDSLELRELFSCIDNTTLNGDDNKQSLLSFCQSTMEMCKEVGTNVAAVCVYPTFVHQAKNILKETNIRVASVAGAFPSGQTTIQIKKQEVQYALDQGADEIDFVINRGAFLDGNYNLLSDEVAAAKELCNEKTLKVIIETGELKTPENIYNASMLSLEAGADFIKTSTGKIQVGATPEAAYIMLTAINEFCKKNKKNIGFKAAGGISSIDDALIYYRMAKKIMDNKNINKQNFRIGTSRLTKQLVKILTY